MLFMKGFALDYNNSLFNQLVVDANVLDITMRYIDETSVMDHPRNKKTFVMLHTDSLFYVRKDDSWTGATEYLYQIAAAWSFRGF